MEFLEKVWTYRQFFLDHKLAVFALLVPTTCSILLFLLVYYNLPDRAIGNTLKSPNFLVPWVLLIVFTASVFMLAGRNVPPPEDGNL